MTKQAAKKEVRKIVTYFMINGNRHSGHWDTDIVDAVNKVIDQIGAESVNECPYGVHYDEDYW